MNNQFSADYFSTSELEQEYEELFEDIPKNKHYLLYQIKTLIYNARNGEILANKIQNSDMDPDYIRDLLIPWRQIQNETSPI